jgi:tRNA pseudouridine38-40 synthase
VRTFRLTLAYDGTLFHGWQIQPGLRTVQGVVEGAVKAVLEDDSVRLAGAGRTDAGVHARGQGVSFVADTRLPLRAIAPLLARRLPDDVRVVDVSEAREGFHARHSAIGRRYAYRLLWRDDVLLSRFGWHPRGMLDPARLRAATAVLEGERDFAAFQSAGSSPVATRCHVHRADWSACEGGVRFDVVADHFLYHMVRNIVGTALRASRADEPAREMRVVLESRDRSRAGVTVPARGLTLEQVFYPPEEA